MSKPFVAGDYVDIAGKSGVVKTVGLFYTVMETFDNTVISIPNGDVTARRRDQLQLRAAPPGGYALFRLL